MGAKTRKFGGDIYFTPADDPKGQALSENLQHLIPCKYGLYCQVFIVPSLCFHLSIAMCARKFLIIPPQIGLIKSHNTV